MQPPAGHLDRHRDDFPCRPSRILPKTQDSMERGRATGSFSLGWSWGAPGRQVQSTSTKHQAKIMHIIANHTAVNWETKVLAGQSISIFNQSTTMSREVRLWFGRDDLLHCSDVPASANPSNLSINSVNRLSSLPSLAYSHTKPHFRRTAKEVGLPLKIRASRAPEETEGNRQLFARRDSTRCPGPWAGGGGRQMFHHVTALAGIAWLGPCRRPCKAAKLQNHRTPPRPRR